MGFLGRAEISKDSLILVAPTGEGLRHDKAHSSGGWQHRLSRSNTIKAETAQSFQSAQSRFSEMNSRPAAKRGTKQPNQPRERNDDEIRHKRQGTVTRGKKHTPVRRNPSILSLVLIFGCSFLASWTLRSVLIVSNHHRSVGVGPFNSSLPAQVVLTALGWNHHDPRVAGQVPRTLFQAGLHQGIIEHPWYNPNGFSDEETQSASSRRRSYVFLDLETCYEENYPNYGWGLTANSDRDGGRPYLSSSGGQIRHMKSICPQIDRILQSSFFRRQDATLVLFDCGWNGPPQWSCLNRDTNVELNDFQVSIVSESASHTSGAKRGPLDLGLPPPAIHPVPMTSVQKAAMFDCHNSETHRPFVFTFTGNFRHAVRKELLKIHDPQKGVIVQHHFGGSWNTTSVGRGVHNRFTNMNGSYTTLLSQSEFAGVPRGDNLFSYRFTEVLSGGCIPVVYADGWVLPFSSQLVDWSSMAVIIPEKDAALTLEYLGNLTIDDRCRMRRKGFEFYGHYMATPEGVIAGIIDSLEKIKAQL